MEKPNKDAQNEDKPVEKTPSFSPDRKGESSAGALASKDKEKSVNAGRDGSNTR